MTGENPFFAANHDVFFCYHRLQGLLPPCKVPGVTFILFLVQPRNFFCCNRQLRKLHPINIFATMAKADGSGKLFLVEAINFFATTGILFCYNRRGNLLHPFMAGMRPGAVATVIAATSLLLATTGEVFCYMALTGGRRSCNPVQQASMKKLQRAWIKVSPV